MLTLGTDVLIYDQCVPIPHRYTFLSVLSLFFHFHIQSSGNSSWMGATVPGNTNISDYSLFTTNRNGIEY